MIREPIKRCKIIIPYLGQDINFFKQIQTFPASPDPGQAGFRRRSLGAELVYTVFLPNVGANSGIPQTIMSWLIRRAIRVGEQLWKPGHGVNLGVHDHD